MAPTQGTSARVQRLTSLVAIVLVAVSVGLSFGRVFEGGAATIRMVSMGLASAVIAWAFERRSLLLATIASGILVAVGLGVAVFLPTTWFGLPTLTTIREMGAAAAQVGEQARLQVAPAQPVVPLLFASATAIWAAIFSCHSLAFRAGSPLLALVPPAALVVFADSVLEDTIRPMYGVLFLLAAMAVLFADSLRRVQGWGPVWSGPGRRDRLLPAAGRGARRVAVAAAVVAVAAPIIVPGFGGRAVIDLSALNAEGGVRLSTLVSIASQLTQGEDQDVFIVRSDVQSYWRLTSLNRFDGVQWVPSEEEPVAVSPDTSLGEAPAGGQPITQTFEITNDLIFPWLATAYQPRSIALDGDVGWVRGSQTALLQGNLEPGDSYTVASTYVEPTPTDLRLVPPAAPPDEALTELSEYNRELLRQIATEWTNDEPTMYDKVYAIQERLRSAPFEYSTEDVSLREDDDSIVEFLRHTRRGFCQQFATAMAVLLRSIDIPARVAVGFTPGERLADATGWRVTTDDYHAWVEVPFGEYGWLAFEPTPTRSNPTASSYASEDVPLSGCRGRQCIDEGGPIDEDPAPGEEGTIDFPFGRGPEGNPDEGGVRGRGDTTDVPVIPPPSPWIGRIVAIALAVTVVLAIATSMLLPPLRRWRRRRAIERAGPSPRAVVLAVYDASLRDARDRGLPRRLGETPEEYAWRLAEAIPSAADRVGRLGRLAELAAYGPRELSDDDVLDAKADAQEIDAALAALRGWRDRLPRWRAAA